MKYHTGLILPDVSAVMRTGSEYLESIRDGRRILLDGKVVDDVTTHPAFSKA